MDILWWILIFIAVMVWIAIAFWPGPTQAGGCPLARQRAQVTGGLWAGAVFGPTGVSAITWRAQLLMITEAAVPGGIGAALVVACAIGILK
jgi:hypothetical protein